MQEVELSAPADDATKARRRPTLTRIATILWAIGVVIVLGSIFAAVEYTANTYSPEGYARLSLVMYPLIAAIAWIPLGMASLILSIIALLRREGGRGWAIAVIFLIALSLACVCLYQPYGVFLVARL